MKEEPPPAKKNATRAPPVSPRTERIAVVGMSCQLPPAIDDPGTLWEFCTRARCSANTIPTTRFDARNFYHPNPSKKGHFNVSAGSYLDRDVALFDAPFFNLSRAEATAIDPQQRLLLESVFVALESAGLDTNALAGRADVGVFAAGSKSDYETRL